MRERLGERFGQMLCNRLGDMLDPNMVGEMLVKMLGLSPECEKRWRCAIQWMCSLLDCSLLDCSSLDCSLLDCSLLDCSLLDCSLLD